MSEKRHTYTVSYNKGLDKTSLPFEASPARALDELNYVYRDGKVQKRFGITQLLKQGGVDYVPNGSALYETNTTEFNGIWRFLAEDGEYHTIVHLGKLLFELGADDSTGEPALRLLYISLVNPSNSNTSKPKCYELENFKSTAFIGNKSLYILGGKQFLRLRFYIQSSSTVTSLTPVFDDADTYVPTTSVSITYLGAKASGRASLDQVNLMTQWRKNLLLSGVGKSETDTSFGYTYQLDDRIVGRITQDLSGIRVKITRREK